MPKWQVLQPFARQIKKNGKKSPSASMYTLMKIQNLELFSSTALEDQIHYAHFGDWQRSAKERQNDVLYSAFLSRTA